MKMLEKIFNVFCWAAAVSVLSVVIVFCGKVLQEMLGL